MDGTDLTLKATFDREAARYGRARPAPPEALVDAMMGRGHLQPGARVLEVGCGTGQATRPLAERGVRVYALELGPTLAALARAHLRDLENVTVQTVAFEDFEADTPYDALVSVQAFHWVEPEAGLGHAASLLRPGGALLLAWHQDRSQNTPFYLETDPIHRRYERPLNRPTPSRTPERFVEALAASPLFSEPRASRYPWSYVYSRERYLDLLLTFSNVQAMEPPTREGFLAEIGEVIDRHGGGVTRLYESVLLSASRR